MEKRADQKRQQTEKFRYKLRKAFAVLFCFVLLIFFINATDMSTRRMIMCNDDRYAMAVSLQEGNLLRLDIAGEKYILNIEPVIRVTDFIVSGSKRCYESIANAIRSGM